VPKTILMLATFGVEIVEVGGTLALHAQAGDNVHVAVLQTRLGAHPQIEQAAQILGAKSVYFFDLRYGEVTFDLSLKMRLVRLLRELRPDIIIMQDPEHVPHDLDPDRRIAMLVYLEALAVSNRDWRIEECGGFAPTAVIPTIYYMWADNPNCVVEISSTMDVKKKAMDALAYQLKFSAKVMKAQLGEEGLRKILPNYDAVKHENLELGRALHDEMDRARALYHGVLGHSGAVMAEAFRHQGPMKFDKLV